METLQTLDKSSCKRCGDMLADMLADTYVLYVKTQNFHWNIIDSRFYSLHLLFEKQYEELAEAVDELAERIRMLGERAPGSMAEFLKLTSLQEPTSPLSGNQMIQALANDHKVIADRLRPAISEATELGDDGTMDLFTNHLRMHEKASWFLQSHLEVKK